MSSPEQILSDAQRLTKILGSNGWKADEHTALVCLIISLELLDLRGYSDEDKVDCVNALIASGAFKRADRWLT